MLTYEVIAHGDRFAIFSGQTFDLVFTRGPARERIPTTFPTHEEAQEEADKLNAAHGINDAGAGGNQ